MVCLLETCRNKSHADKRPADLTDKVQRRAYIQPRINNYIILPHKHKQHAGMPLLRQLDFPLCVVRIKQVKRAVARECLAGLTGMVMQLVQHLVQFALFFTR